jgi:hypothetical protein
MRYYAMAVGFSLSDKGLFPAVRKGKEKVAKGASIICYTEVNLSRAAAVHVHALHVECTSTFSNVQEAIFAALGLEYKAPQDRNCFDVSFVDDDYKETAKGHSQQLA